MNLDLTFKGVYDSTANALYITVSQQKAVKTMPINKNTLVDFDKDENIVGVEILSYINERTPKTFPPEPDRESNKSKSKVRSAPGM